MQCPFFPLPLLLLTAVVADMPGADGISGVYAGNNTLYVEGTQPTGNSIAVSLDSTGAYMVVTVNGQSVAYDADGINDITVTGGPGGGDSIDIGPLYLAQTLEVSAITGHNTITLDTGNILANSTTLVVYGDDNILTATAPTVATVLAYGGTHNTYTPSSSFILSNTASVPYSPSSIPGVFMIDDQVVVIPQNQSGNQISVQAPTSGSGKIQVTENGQTTPSFGIFTPSAFLYQSGMAGGDTITIASSVSLQATFFGNPATISLGSGGAYLNLFTSGHMISIPSGAIAWLNEYDPGLSLLTENVSGGGTGNPQRVEVAPMLAVSWTGSASGSSPASGGPTPAAPAEATSSSSGHHCGIGGGSALLLAVAFFLASASRDVDSAQRDRRHWLGRGR